MLALPHTSDQFDIGSAIFDCDDPVFEGLDIEQHTLGFAALDPLAKPEINNDVGFATRQPQLSPFPIVGPDIQSRTIFVRRPLDFYEMFQPYLTNASVELLADDPDLELKPPPPASNASAPHPNIICTLTCSSLQSPVTTSQRKPPRPRRRLALIAKIQAGLKHTATIKQSAITLEDQPMTRGEWKGQDFSHRLESEGLREAWLKGKISERLANEKYRFMRVPYEGKPTCFVDKSQIMYAFRTERLPWLLDLMPLGSQHRTHQDCLNWECAEYQRLCGDNSQDAIDLNHRGDHWASKPGVDRQIKQKPTWTKFHRDHKNATDWLLTHALVTIRLIKFAASTLRIRFPVIAQRVDRCTKNLLEMGIEPAIATPLFGLWYNYCINGARPHAGIDGVSCQPHTDAQNLAIMMCEFDWNEMAWLVLWEARLIIQLPIGVLFFYPSALFIHFNINICDLNNYIYTTKNQQPPTPQNCDPIKGVKGRGSIVFFNQASVFQYAELRSTVKAAAKQGLSTDANNEPYLMSMPRVDVE
ncbi:hypothetical protein GSI_12379 [Ganoderma sinense ZZ0214-1]|uniref:Uncharacterized protein n=1 Tax=Ganoderma sinense ZZ0214-1 TaxID=1077348 RepID=A0A2G8RVJ8_9APHY|nr:hypothetical protein GSI_12379 [Ganoderma sinense ZZ0214-1]